MTYPIKNASGDAEVEVDLKPEANIHPPDGGWGWAVCFATFMTNFTVAGMNITNGIILLGLLDVYNESVSITSLVGSVITGLSMFGGPVVLILILCKASHRQIMMVGGIIAAASTVASTFAPKIEILIFTYGVLAGLSVAISLFAANVILACYFDKKRTLALGIANSGSGFGGFVLSYFVERSISFYGTRGTFLLIGGIFLNLTVYGSLCRPLKSITKSNISESGGNSEDEEEKVKILSSTEDENNEILVGQDAASYQYSSEGMETIPTELQVSRLSIFSHQSPGDDLSSLFQQLCATEIFRNKTYGILLIIYMLSAVGHTLLLYLPLYAESVGLNRGEGAVIMSIFGVISILSHIFVGFLADVIHIPISYLLLVALVGVSTSIAFIPFCQTFATLASSTVLFAVSYSFVISLRIVLLAAAVGIEKLPQAYSIMSMLIGVGFIVYPIITGIVYDSTHSFVITFYMHCAITSLAAILSSGVIYSQRKGKFV